jgi:hypothetical protein
LCEKPALDYAAIRAGGPRAQEYTEPPNVQRTPAPDAALAHEGLDPIAYRYKPNSASEDLFRPGETSRMDKRRSRAATRADELMAGPPKVPEHTTLKRTSSQLAKAKAAPHRSSMLAAPRPDFADKPRVAGRTDSMETTGSTPQTETTDYPWSASTAMTSAANTPARGSKRTSSQALPRGPENHTMFGFDANEAEYMLNEMEKDTPRQKDVIAEPALPATALPSVRSDSKATTPPKHSAAPSTGVPARKPVPTSGSATSRPPTRQTHELPQANTTLETYQVDIVAAAPALSHTQSRRGRQVTMDKDSMPARAASRARSITRDVKDYMRSASRSRQATRVPDMPHHRRSESRSRQMANNVMEYLVPGSSNGSRKPSVDVSRGPTRPRSRESLKSAVSGTTAPEESTRNHWKAWKPYHHVKGSVSNADLGGRNRRPDAPARGRSDQDEAGDESPTKPTGKRTVNLNRELPPLPGLSSWKEPSQAVSAQASTLLSNTSSPVTPSAPKTRPMKRAATAERQKYIVAATTTDNKDAYATAIQGELHDIVASRMGAPVKSKPQTYTPTGSAAGKVRQTLEQTRPAVPKHTPPAPPPAAYISRKSADLDSARSPDAPAPVMPDSSTVGSNRAATGRRRTKSTQLPDMSEQLRSSAAVQSPDGKPIVATGKAHFLTSRTPSYGKLSGLARAMSTNTGRRQVPSSPLHANNSSTPLGHMRDTSDGGRLVEIASMDKYSRSFDLRQQDAMDAASYRSGLSTPRSGSHVAADSSTSKNKQSSKKWWKFGAGHTDASKKQQTWMENVVRSGANSGVLVADDSSNPPAVRY